MITAMPRIAIATNDFEGIVSTFRDTFGLPVVDISASSVDSLGARLAMCVPEGGSNIELMSPAVAEAPLSQSLQKFLDRRGEGPFALMLEAPDPNAEAEVLLERGLGVLPLMEGAGGRDVHPKSTHGVLIRVYPNGSFQAAADQIESDAAKTLGLSGIGRVIIAVRDLDHATDVYGRQFDMKIGEPEVDGERGVAAVVCEPAQGGVIELVATLDEHKPFAASVAAHLESKGEGMYALVLRAANVAAAGSALGERGLPVGPSGQAGSVEVELFGTRILIEPV